MMGHARALVNVKDLKRQHDIFKSVINSSLSVRQVEEMVKDERENLGGTYTKSADRFFDFTDSTPFFTLSA